MWRVTIEKLPCPADEDADDDLSDYPVRKSVSEASELASAVSSSLIPCNTVRPTLQIAELVKQSLSAPDPGINYFADHNEAVTAMLRKAEKITEGWYAFDTR